MYFVMLVFLSITSVSCDSLSISDKDDVVEIQKIIDESFRDEAEVYDLTISAEHLSNELKRIGRTYKVEKENFYNFYNHFNKKVSNPIKTKIAYGRTTTFKIKDINLSIIPEKYKAAIDILRDKKILKLDEEYPLSSWSFKVDDRGEMYSEFNLDYYIGSSSQGRTKKTTYSSYKFKVDSNNKVLFIK